MNKWHEARGERRTILSPLAYSLLPLSFFFGCTSESSQSGVASGSSQSNRPPSIQSAAIVPNPVVRSGPISIQVEAVDPDRDAVTFRHQWLLNGHPIEGQTGPTLAPDLVKRGDLVAVEVIPSDGKTQGSPYRTKEVAIGNTPPEVTQIVLVPSEVQVGDRLRAKVEGSDVDQDEIQYTFKWWRNNAPLKESDEGVLDTTGFTRGDTILVQATPHDYVGPGKARYAEQVTIANSPPRITSIPPTAINQGRYEYAVTASDPDGDPVTYTLETAPAGMSIDKATGRIEWRIAAETKGTHRVRVVVEDDRKGHAFQDFDLFLAPPASS
ncbi:MAG TPA: putative Ig domain-containing protein [Nitrospiraceae bacterium]|nr:putative Ig domain-containing protein [Nitrospiraceae bacterium]